MMTRFSSKMHQLHSSHIPTRRSIHNVSSRSSLNYAPITSHLGSAFRRTSPSPPSATTLPTSVAVSSTLFYPSGRYSSSNVTCNSYATPDVYDIAFSFRDFEAEVAFLLAAYQIHSSGGAPLTRFLELGCGPARHSILLSQATGATCIGLDLSKEMLAYASQQAQQANLSSEKIKFIQGDMTSSQGISSLIPGEGLVDVAAIMLGTLSHCLDNGAALSCFQNVAEVVRPGGILVLELSHPGELFGGSFLDPLDFVDCWEVSEDGEVEFAEKRRSKFQHGDEMDPEQQAAAETEGKEEEFEDDDEDLDNEDDAENDENKANKDGLRRVLVEYGREGDDFDPATQVLQRTVGLSLFSKEGELVSSDVSVVAQRQFSLQEIDLLARATGKWVVKGVYGDLDVDVPLDGEDSYRMVVVLQRKD